MRRLRAPGPDYPRGAYPGGCLGLQQPKELVQDRLAGEKPDPAAFEALHGDPRDAPRNTSVSRDPPATLPMRPNAAAPTC